MERSYELFGVPSSDKCEKTNLHEAVGFGWASTYFWLSESGKRVKHEITLIFKSEVWTEYKEQALDSEPGTKVATKNWVAFISNRQQKKDHIKQSVNL